MFFPKWLLRTVVVGWAASFAGAATAADTVVRQFSAGSTGTTVGIAAAGEDVELTGPQALTSDAQGNLFVLDQINGRILRFNPKQPAGDPGILKMPADVQPNDLVVCKSATGITATTCGAAANALTNQTVVIAIVYSIGKNGSLACAPCVDEAANTDGDRVFVFHTPAPVGATNGEFDDYLIWITVGELYGRLISAGVLP